MPENIVPTPLAPMERHDVANAIAYIRAMQARDIDTACAVADDTGPELHRLLLNVAARVIIPVTAADDHEGEPCAHSFLAAALGRILLELLCHGECLAGLPSIADTSPSSPTTSSPRTAAMSPTSCANWRPRG